MLIVVGGIKGGAGKTTLATNLAAYNARLKKTLLIDSDEQRSTSDWANQRQSTLNDHMINDPLTTISLVGKNIHAQITNLKEDYDDIFVDAGGRDTTTQRSALVVADVFIVPFKPRSYDIWTMGYIKELVEQIQIINPKLQAYYVINQGDPRGKDNDDAVSILNEAYFLKQIPVVVHQRKSFSNAASDGLCVLECSEKDEKACKELVELHEFIFSQQYANNICSI